MACRPECKLRSVQAVWCSVFAAAQHLAIEHQMLGDAVEPLANVWQHAKQFVGRKVRQESQFPQIDSENGNLMIGHLVRGPQNRAIAPHDDGEIGLDIRQIGFEFQIEENDLGHLFNQWTQALRFAGDLRPLAQCQHNHTWTSLRHDVGPTMRVFKALKPRNQQMPCEGSYGMILSDGKQCEYQQPVCGYDWPPNGVGPMVTMILDPDLEQHLRAERAASGGDRYDEVWEGLYVMSPLADNEHQDLQFELGAAIKNAVGAKAKFKVYCGANVSDREDQWEHNYRCPDVVVFAPGTAAKNCGTHWCGGPDFAVEITSPHDRSREKLDFYGKIGVRELLIVDRSTWTLELYRLHGHELKLDGTSAVADHHSLASHVLGVAFRLLPVQSDQSRPAIELIKSDGSQSWLI